MPDIKTRDVVSGTIKTLDRSALAGQRMKDAYVQAKDKAEHSVYSSERNSEEYASEQITNGASTVAREAVHEVDVQGHRIIHGAQKQIAKHQEMRQSQQTNPENPQVPPNTPRTEQTTPNAQQPHRISPDGAVSHDSRGRNSPITVKQESIRNQQIKTAKSELKAKRASRPVIFLTPQPHSTVSAPAAKSVQSTRAFGRSCIPKNDVWKAAQSHRYAPGGAAQAAAPVLFRREYL